MSKGKMNGEVVIKIQPQSEGCRDGEVGYACSGHADLKDMDQSGRMALFRSFLQMLEISDTEAVVFFGDRCVGRHAV
ncbi:MAG: hypothetical protein IJW45_08395 [Oscillospiraceae bacterium]|nr:hypothetical protein [Oscillospiraceae bacterium]